MNGIPAKLLCLHTPALTAPLTRILSLSLSSGIVLDEWTTTRIVSLHKIGSLQDKGNFTPLSILSTLHTFRKTCSHIHSQLCYTVVIHVVWFYVYHMCRNTIVLHVGYTPVLHVWIMSITGVLHMYYRLMNYMCNTPKTPHMYYMCITHVIHMWHIW